MLAVRFLLDAVSGFVLLLLLLLLVNCQCFAKRMTDLQSQMGLELQGNLEVARSVIFNRRHKRAATASFPFVVSEEETRVVEGEIGNPGKIIDLNLPTPSLQRVGESLASGNNNNNSTIAISMMSSDSSSNNEVVAASVSTARDTIVVLITLTIIFFTLAASYFFWRKHRSRIYLTASSGGTTHSVYMYSRLSQNDVEVDNISFQGDLTHKAVVHQVVPVAQSCVEDESCDDDLQVQPATLCLEYDSLVTISNQEDKSESRGNQRNKNPSINRRHSSSSAAFDDTPVNLLIDELSDEDLLQ